MVIKFKQMKNVIRFTTIFIIGFLLGISSYAQDRVTYSDAPASEKVKFHDIFELSDGTFLLTGESRFSDFSWTGVALTILDTSDLAILSSSEGITSSDFLSIFNMGFIMHLSEDRNTILNVVTFPQRFVENIYKIRSTNVPGEETGTLFISGKAKAPSEGYFIARLNDNFVNGLPTTCDWFRFVPTGRVENYSGCYDFHESHHRTEQPWDVDNEGRITYVERAEYSHGSWVSIYRLEPDGRRGIVPQFPYHHLHYSYDNRPGDGKDSLIVEFADNYLFPVIDSTITLELTYQVWDDVGFAWVDSVALTTVTIDSGYSRIALKHAGTGGCKLLRSMVESDYEWQTADENGHLRITGKYPYDYLFAFPFYDTVNYPGNLETMEGPGVLGHYPDLLGGGVRMCTDKINDIVIDKRNNHLYLGVSQAIKNSHIVETGYMSEYDPCSHSSLILTFESQLVALNEQGFIKWWSRLHKDVPLDSSGASKFLDKITLDYQNDRLLVLARQYNVDTINLWEGDQITANPGAEGFKNRFTGTNRKIQQSWIGKYHLDTLLLDAATYVAEYAADASLSTQALSDENMDNWNNPNQGNPDLGNTVCYDIKVDADGNVLVACTGERVITTSNAYQRMVHPDQDEVKDSLAPELNAFVRKYSPDLSNVIYSSLVTGEWDRVNGEGGDNTKINRILPVENSILAVGSDDSKGNNVASYHIHPWGNHTASGEAGIFAELSLEPKLRITSFVDVAGFNTDYDLEFSAPSDITFDPSNEFSVEISTSDGTFRETSIVGTLESDQPGTIVVNIPKGLVEQGTYRFRVVSDSPVYYSDVKIVEVPSLFCSDTLEVVFSSEDTLACKNTSAIYEVNNICGVHEWHIVPPAAGQIVSTRDSNSVEIEWSDYTGSVELFVKVSGADSLGIVHVIYSDTLSLEISGFNSYIIADTVAKKLTAYPNGDVSVYEYQWRILSGYLPRPWTSDSTFSPVEMEGGVTVTVRDLTTGCLAAATDTINLYESGNNSILQNKISNIEVVLYPNPSDGKVSVDLSGVAGLNPLISVYRKDGVLVYTKLFNNLIEDNHVETIDLTSQAPGLYLIRIRVENEQWSQRMLIIR